MNLVELQDPAKRKKLAEELWKERVRLANDLKAVDSMLAACKAMDPPAPTYPDR